MRPHRDALPPSVIAMRDRRVQSMEEDMRLIDISLACGVALLISSAAFAEDTLAPTADAPVEAVIVVDDAQAIVEVPATTDLAETDPSLPMDAMSATDEASAANPVAAEIDMAGDEGELAWDQFDDPDFDPTAAAPAPAESGTGAMAGVTLDANAASTRGASGIVLGPKGVDGEGRTGRLHTVARGDTLWDLAAAYLGTPWVWPSVWIDNDDIDNPHRISPGDKIWITANEMRVVTAAEAESFIAPATDATPEQTAATSMPMMEEAPAAFDEAAEAPPLAALDAPEDDPSTLDAFPVAIPGQEPTAMTAGRQVTVASRHAYGFVSTDDLAGASTIVDSPSERTFLSAGDKVYLGLGEGDTEIGDQFMIFRVTDEVRDFQTNRIIGHHVENLGWAEVRELTGDTSIAEIRESYAEFRRGAKIVARPAQSRHVTVRSTPDAIEGHLVYLPSDKTLSADGGYVYLNRGEFHGVEVGSELEVFESGRVKNEGERRVDVRTPDQSIATLVVISVEEESAVAFVLSAIRELEIGDTVRPAMPRRVAQR